MRYCHKIWNKINHFKPENYVITRLCEHCLKKNYNDCIKVSVRKLKQL